MQRDQSFSSISLRILSRTSRKPPLSFLTDLGLRVLSSSTLSTFTRTREGLPVGFEEVLSEVAFENSVDAGISSQSSPDNRKERKKKGQSFMRMSIDSCASATEIGTGEDFRMAATTSDVGSARRFLEAGIDDEDPGV